MLWREYLVATVGVGLMALQGPVTESTLVEYAKGIDASRLDHALPSQPLASWMTSLGSASKALSWRRSDCDLKPDPAAPRDERLICAEFVVTLAESIGIKGVIVVGTEGKGIDGPPRFHEMWAMKGPLASVQIVPAKRLSQLPALLAKARAWEKEARGRP